LAAKRAPTYVSREKQLERLRVRLEQEKGSRLGGPVVNL
jgi:hypothetical protein